MNTIASPSRSRICDVVADALVGAGIDAIFGLMGEDNAPLLVSAVARGIAYYPARHENQAVAMADGYARATGRTGVAAVTGGPGFSNAITAINTAHRAGSAVVVLVGAGRPTEDDLDPGVIRQCSPASWLKHFPQAKTLELLGIDVLRPLTGATAGSDASTALARGKRGTVALVLGRNLLLEAVASTGDATPAALEEPAPVAPDPRNIAELADLLQETWAVSRPLILAGRGAVLSGAAPALRRLSELTGALLATTLRATGLFGADPYHVGVCGTFATPVASELITQADCVLAFGAALNQMTTYGNTLFPKAMVVQVDVDQAAPGRFVDVELAICADARLAAQALVDELERRRHAVTGFRTPETRERIAAFRTSDRVRDQGTPELIDPRVLMHELDRILPADRILCADVGQHARFALSYLHVERPENFVQASEAGSIGLGLGTGIGAAIGRPGELVVVAAGDGGMMMSLGDLETAVRLQLPLLVVVSNDEALSAEVNVLADLGMDPRLARIPAPSFAAIASAMGARSATVRSAADLGVVDEWLRERRDRPLVLDCRVHPGVRWS